MKTSLVRHSILIVVVLFGMSSVLQAQTRDSHKSTSASSMYADPFPAGRETAHVLGPSEKEATFRLTTSWIPGPDHKGYFRWQIGVVGEAVSLSEAPKFINSLHKCDFTLNLYDHGGFVLRHVSVAFIRSVADSGDVTAMYSNDLIQMDLSEYQKFVLGSWDMSWACPEA